MFCVQVFFPFSCWNMKRNIADNQSSQEALVSSPKRLSKWQSWPMENWQAVGGRHLIVVSEEFRVSSKNASLNGWWIFHFPNIWRCGANTLLSYSQWQSKSEVIVRKAIPKKKTTKPQYEQAFTFSLQKIAVRLCNMWPWSYNDRGSHRTEK